MHFSISHRYALSLFDLCKHNDWLDIVYQDFKSIESLLDVSPELSDFFSNPQIGHQRRTQTIDKLFKDKIHEVSLRILLFLEEKKHVYLLKEIVAEFIGLYRKERNILKIKIISSMYLDEKQIQAICEQLKTKFKKEIEYDLVIDQSLIGGLKIMMGDTVYDFSFKTQLNRFREKLLTSV